MIAPIVSVIGSIASAEAIKLIVGAGKRNAGFVHVDLWENNLDVLPSPPRTIAPRAVSINSNIWKGNARIPPPLTSAARCDPGQPRAGTHDQAG